MWAKLIWCLFLRCIQVVFFLSQLIKMNIELCVKLQCTACFAMTACYCKLTVCKLGLLIEKLRGGAKLYVGVSVDALCVGPVADNWSLALSASEIAGEGSNL